MYGIFIFALAVFCVVLLVLYIMLKKKLVFLIYVYIFIYYIICKMSVCNKLFADKGTYLGNVYLFTAGN